MRTQLLLKTALVSCICLLTQLTSIYANWPGEASDWKGFKRFDFEVEGRACYVVTPEKAIDGNPWVWRARFPNFHTGADLILLEQGFHIAFMDTNGMLGSPRAMKHWDAFYDTMTQTYGLSSMPALEAVSRGGLFAYRWASRNPDKVSCIYADTPVCDFKSWPLGQGEGLGNPKTWQALLEEYGFTQEQALAFDENPIDVLKPIADWKIPLMTIISMNDQVVPPAENTFVLASRYRELGGSIELITVIQGTEKSNGHHFTHPDPEGVASFITDHTLHTQSLENYSLKKHFIKAGVQGTFVLYDSQNDRHVAHNSDRLGKRFLPASTFKIPNSIIALETGAVNDLEEVIPYGGGKEYFKSWEKDMTLPQAFKASNVAVYHTIAKRVGVPNYKEKLKAFGYGNQNPGATTDDRFWLIGPIQISALEQVEFLHKLSSQSLPISSKTYQQIRSMMKVDGGDNYRVFAKSGWAGPDDPQIGWWVGWVEKDGHNYPFALNILIKTNEDAKQREIIARNCLNELLELD